MKVYAVMESKNLMQSLQARKEYLQVRIGNLENTRATDSK